MSSWTSSALSHRLSLFQLEGLGTVLSMSCHCSLLLNAEVLAHVWMDCWLCLAAVCISRLNHDFPTSLWSLHLLLTR